MTPELILEYSKFGVLGLFAGTCLFLYWQEVQAHKETRKQLTAAQETTIKDREALIARYDSTVGKVTDGLVEAAEAMTASRIDAAWERNQTERRKR